MKKYVNIIVFIFLAYLKTNVKCTHNPIYLKNNNNNNVFAFDTIETINEIKKNLKEHYNQRYNANLFSIYDLNFQNLVHKFAEQTISPYEEAIKTANISHSCSSQLLKFLNAFRKKEFWAYESKYI
jgi:flagellin-specific chaperone FliS